jgi:DNA primase
MPRSRWSTCCGGARRKGKVFDSPERKAALDKTLRAALMRIADPSIRAHYGEDIKRLRWELFGTRPTKRAFVPLGGKRKPEPLPPHAATRGARSWRRTRRARMRRCCEAVLLATLVTHPALIRAIESELESVELAGPTMTRCARSCCGMRMRPKGPPKKSPKRRAAFLKALFARSHVRSAPPAEPRGCRTGDDVRGRRPANWMPGAARGGR